MAECARSAGSTPSPFFPPDQCRGLAPANEAPCTYIEFLACENDACYHS